MFARPPKRSPTACTRSRVASLSAALSARTGRHATANRTDAVKAFPSAYGSPDVFRLAQIDTPVPPPAKRW